MHQIEKWFATNLSYHHAWVSLTDVSNIVHLVCKTPYQQLFINKQILTLKKRLKTYIFSETIDPEAETICDYLPHNTYVS